MFFLPSWAIICLYVLGWGHIWSLWNRKLSLSNSILISFFLSMCIISPFSSLELSPLFYSSLLPCSFTISSFLSILLCTSVPTYVPLPFLHSLLYCQLSRFFSVSFSSLIPNSLSVLCYFPNFLYTVFPLSSFPSSFSLSLTSHVSPPLLFWTWRITQQMLQSSGTVVWWKMWQSYSICVSGLTTSPASLCSFPVIYLADTSQKNIFCTFILAHIHFS